MSAPPTEENLELLILRTLHADGSADRLTIRDRIEKDLGRFAGPGIRRKINQTRKQLRKRGYVRYAGADAKYHLTEAGREVLCHAGSRIPTEGDNDTLPDTEPAGYGGTEDGAKQSMADIAEKWTDTLADEILEHISADKSGRLLEDVAGDLLVKMGYGTSAGASRTGGPGDGGIDGVIRLDPFGLDLVCYQAKVRDGNVPVGELRNFGGALAGAPGTTKGLFITTAKGFARSAEKYASDMQIALVNGPELARLMIQHNVGVRFDDAGADDAGARETAAIEYRIKCIDEDYFEGR